MSFYTSQTEAEFNGGIVLKGNRNGEEYNITDDKAVLDFFRDNSGILSSLVARIFLRFLTLKKLLLSTSQISEKEV